MDAGRHSPPLGWLLFFRQMSIKFEEIFHNVLLVVLEDILVHSRVVKMEVLLIMLNRKTVLQEWPDVSFTL